MIVFFLSIMPLAVDLASLTPARFALIAFVSVLVLSATLSAYALAAESGARLDALDARDGRCAQGGGRRDGRRRFDNRHEVNGAVERRPPGRRWARAALGGLRAAAPNQAR